MIALVVFLVKISNSHNVGFFPQKYVFYKLGLVKFSVTNTSLANIGKINQNTKSSTVYLVSMKSRCDEIKAPKMCVHASLPHIKQKRVRKCHTREMEIAEA